MIFDVVVDAEPAAQWAGAAATWTPSFLLLPALSRAEPEFFLFKGQVKPEGRNRPSILFDSKAKSTFVEPARLWERDER